MKAHKGDFKMKETNDDFEQYLEDLTQDIADSFVIRPDHDPYSLWTDFIMSRFTKVV